MGSMSCAPADRQCGALMNRASDACHVEREAGWALSLRMANRGTGRERKREQSGKSLHQPRAAFDHRPEITRIPAY